MEESIARLMEALGGQAGRVWPDVVRMVYLNSLWWLIFNICCLVLAPVGVLLCRRKASAIVREKGNNYMSGDEESMIWFLRWGSFLVATGVVIIMLIALPMNLSGVMFPEARAASDILMGAR